MSRICAAYRCRGCIANPGLPWRLIGALVVLLAGASAPRAQGTSAPLPLAPEVRTGTLPNGLTYFVRQNARPADRVFLRLAVKAGSVDEADDQRGLAHMLEHMAFNGTAHFKPGELVSYLESIGARFGPHVNAYTSFDETVYMLDLPTERPDAVSRGFDALSDFAGGMTLDPAEIDRERGVVIEEWRGRLGAGTRMQEPQLRALFGASRYADRLPIGTPEILKSFTAQRLRDFYEQQYRPDRMAVIAVGDVDPAVLERIIRDRFGALAARPPASRPVYDIPDHRETRYVSVSDREAQGSSVTVVFKQPRLWLRTADDYRRSLLVALAHQMIGARFAEIARRPEAPFLGAGSGNSVYGRTVEAFSISARVEDGGIEAGVRSVGEEIARLREHGFGDAELARAKRATLAGYERAFNERDTSESDDYASELVRHFLEDEAAPGIEKELELVRQFFPTVSASEVAAMVRSLLPEGNRVVLAVAPEKPGLAAITEASLRRALAAGTAASVPPWRDDVAGRELLATRPAGGAIAGRREIAEIGVTVLTFSNGVEAWLKPTDFRNDQIVFTSYARGGLSGAPQKEYENAALATALVGISGVGGITPIDLNKLLAGKLASASAYMSSATHGVAGAATPRDIETALQLAYLQFTAPNQDAQAFELLKRRLEAGLANQAQSPGAVFGERVRRVNTMDHYTARALRLEDVPRLNAEHMLAFYRERFANAANFTFFFVGAFKVDELAPLLATYLGSLPSKGVRDANSSDVRLQFPAAIVRETVAKGQEPRAQTVITFFADTGLEELETHRLQAATEVLEVKLREILREQLGGTYSVGVGYSNTSPVPGYGVTSVQFGSAPGSVDALTKAVMSELDRLRREGPTAADVQAVKEAEKNGIRESLRQNGYWLNSLQAMHLLRRDPRRILSRIERADSLTPENVHAALEKYFPGDRYTVLTLVPEAAAAAQSQ